MTQVPAHVLVVDDDPLVLATIAMQIERAGFAVSVAGTGAAAMQRCAAVRPQIAVVDLRLPDMSGITLIRQLRGLMELPCVLLTGMDDGETAAQAHAAGASMCLRKPVDPGRLTSVLDELLRGAHLHGG